MLMWGDKPVFGLTPGAFRNYLYPVFTPAGFAVTSESPADHPHHHSIWVGADHVNVHVPALHGTEVYSYNFYVNDVFQGRAPGRIVQTGPSASTPPPAAAAAASVPFTPPPLETEFN